MVKRPAFLLFMLALAAMVALMATRVAYADEQIPVSMTYQVYCARCHGDTGHGDGPDGGTLSPKPADFADAAVMSKVSDATIIKAIKDGGAAVGLSRDMPAWGDALDDAKIKALTAYIRTFSKK